MDYNTMTDKDIIRDLADRVEKIRIAHHIKESEMEEIAGISRKTLYNFRQGTGLSLKKFIRLLRAMKEADRLQRMFPESESYSPRGRDISDRPKRVRDKQKSEERFQWGDEK
jgi:IS30 family transposase